MNYREISDDWQLSQVLHEKNEEVRRCAFKGVDMTAETELSLSHTYRDCIFLGCNLPKGIKRRMTDSLVFPRMGETFDTFPSQLYSAPKPYP